MADQLPEPEDYRFLLERKPFVREILDQFKELFAPAKQPELVLESKPIPVKDIWSPPKPLSSRISSIAVHLAVIGIMMLPFWRPVRQQITKLVDTQLFLPQVNQPQIPRMRRLSGGGAPVVRPQPKLIQTPQPTPITAPTAMVPVAIATAVPSFGNIGPISGPPGAGSGSGGGDGGTGSGSEDGNCVGANCGEGSVGSGPVPIYQPDPEYSDAARKAKFQGTCVVLITIGADGHVSHPKVLQALGLGLDQKAIEAVLTWRFIPAKDKNGHPMPVTAEVELNFHLY